MRRARSSRLWGARVALALGTLLGPLDTAVNIAFPAIGTSFGFGAKGIFWVVVPFVLAQSSLILAFGKIGDRGDYRRVFAAGLAACAVTHALTAIADDPTSFVLARVLQGLAVGLTLACAPALVLGAFAPEQRRRALSTYAVLFGSGLALGPLLGGVLADWWGWEAVFWFRVPIALVAALALFYGWRQVQHEGHALRASDTAPTKPAGARAPFDAAGAAVLALGFLALTLTIGALQSATVSGSVAASLVVATLLLLGGFILIERHAADPIIDLRRLLAPGVPGLQLLAVTLQATTFSIMLVVPFALAADPVLPGWADGALLATFPAAAVIGGAWAGHGRTVLPAHTLVVTGSAGAVAGLLLAAVASLLGWPLLLGCGLAATGLGLGAFQVGHLEATLAAMREGDRGVAGSLTTLARLLGLTLGAPLAASAFALVEASGRDADDAAGIVMLGAAAILAAIFLLQHANRVARAR